MQLRWYQAEAIESLFNYFGQNKSGNPIIAMPTGTGKSIIIAGFVENVLRLWPNQRFIIATHVKELVEQNAKKLAEMWPIAPFGINSAGLKQRDVIQPVIFGGIASIRKQVELLGHRDLLLIDECHLLSPNADTMYMKFIEELKKINPWLRSIGFSATPFRLGQGMLTDGGMFTDICYDMTSLENFNRLVREGWIAPLIPKRTQSELDVSGVSIAGGDFVQHALQEAVDRDDVTTAALREAITHGIDRRSWLAFASGIEHAEHVAQRLQSFGISAAAIHSKISTEERTKRINAFKNGELRCAVNNNVLTTGFDHPPIDMIIMLRPTMSTGLWVQMLGRGTRPYNYQDIHQYIPGFNYVKQNCLVLDFAGNTRRLGPINDPQVPRRRGGTPGDAPVKECDQCGTYNHIRVQFCDWCGNEFQFQVRITGSAATDQLIRTEIPEVEWFDVHYITYNEHNKAGSPPMVKVTYYCGSNIFHEFLCFEHEGYARVKARRWWRERMQHMGVISDPPDETQEALQYINNAVQPVKIKVWKKRQYPEILSYDFG